METEFSRVIWDKLLLAIGNPYGVAALMGNLQAESGLCPYRLQGDFSEGYATSLEYTAAVDSGEISKDAFVNNGPGGGGYGLAQWTYPPRKTMLYNMWLTGGYVSIGDIDLACDFLIYELNTDYSGVMAVLKTATNVREASDAVLHDFENPADQSEAVEETRAAMGQAWYNQYHGEDPEPVPGKKKKKMSLLLMWAAVKRW